LAEKVLNALDFECYEGKCSGKGQIREQFKFLFQTAIRRIFESARTTLEDKTLAQLANYKYSLANYDKFGENVATVFYLIKGHKWSQVKKLVEQITVDTFGSIDVMRYGHINRFGDELHSALKELSAEANLSAFAVQKCAQDLRVCGNGSQLMNEAYAATILPGFVTQVSNKDLPLGYLASFVADNVISNFPRNVFYKFPSRSGSRQNAQKLTEILKTLANSLFGGEIGISSVELPVLLDLPKTSPKSEASSPLGAHACTKIWLKNRWRDEENLTSLCPSEDSKFRECCQMFEKINGKLDEVLWMMKFSMQQPHLTLSREEFNEEMKHLSKVLSNWSTLKPYVYDNQTKLPLDSNSRIFECLFVDKSCRFVRSFTNEGFGFTLNPNSFQKLHKMGRFNRLFHAIMHPVVNNDQVVSSSKAWASGLTLTLRQNKYTKVGLYHKPIYLTKYDGFRVSSFYLSVDNLTSDHSP